MLAKDTCCVGGEITTDEKDIIYATNVIFDNTNICIVLSCYDGPVCDEIKDVIDYYRQEKMFEKIISDVEA